MYKKTAAAMLLFLGFSTQAEAADYVVDVNGIVCEFCSLGVTKKVAKLPFIDKTRYTNGVDVDIENQKVTIAVKDGAELDVDALFEAIESGGYNPIRVRALGTDKANGESGQ